MPCYHPIEAWDYSPEQMDMFDLTRKVSFRAPHPSDREKMIRQGRRLLLPCRHCVGCRLSKSREWANRVVMEQLYHDQSWFVTLTYDDEHLPRSKPVDPATGEILSCHATLVKDDLQRFFKRLRKNSCQKMRYFAAGEYGSNTYRPHYHILLFGLDLQDLTVVSHNFAGTPYYTSDLISKCWTAGYHIIGKVTWQSAAYTARYTLKKATHGFDKSYYKAAGIEPEFQVMSNRPGIAYQYYVDHPNIFEYDYFNVSTLQGGRRVYPPEYFRKLFKTSAPYDALNRALNAEAENNVKQHLKLLLTDNDFYDILSIEEDKKLSQLTGLIRDTI